MKACAVVLLFGCLAASVSGHGYFMDPPGRASAWRYGFDVPADYNDNECFCGGFNYQYEVNGGKCGICGDPWDEDPREHEVGSIYATGTLVRNYTQGQVITVVANVTANHLGHFEYTICANNDVTVEATQECLDKTPLYAVGHDEWFLYIGDATGAITHELQLPADLVCTQCVMQWRYVASNTWGTCENGTQGMGCGPQEEFRACADVSIRPAVQADPVPLEAAVVGDALVNSGVKDDGAAVVGDALVNSGLQDDDAAVVDDSLMDNGVSKVEEMASVENGERKVEASKENEEHAEKKTDKDEKEHKVEEEDEDDESDDEHKEDEEPEDDDSDESDDDH